MLLIFLKLMELLLYKEKPVQGFEFGHIKTGFWLDFQLIYGHRAHEAPEKLAQFYDVWQVSLRISKVKIVQNKLPNRV